MTHLDVADWIVIVEFAVAFFGLLYFVIRYALSTESDWRKSAAGRHMMLFRSSLCAFMAMGAAHNFLTEYPGRDFVRITVIGVFAASVIQGDRLLTRAQNDHRAAMAARERRATSSS
jgi:hypothetical protein